MVCCGALQQRRTGDSTHLGGLCGEASLALTRPKHAHPRAHRLGPASPHHQLLGNEQVNTVVGFRLCFNSAFPPFTTFECFFANERHPTARPRASSSMIVSSIGCCSGANNKQPHQQRRRGAKAASLASLPQSDAEVRALVHEAKTEIARLRTVVQQACFSSQCIGLSFH